MKNAEGERIWWKMGYDVLLSTVFLIFPKYPDNMKKLKAYMKLLVPFLFSALLLGSEWLEVSNLCCASLVTGQRLNYSNKAIFIFNQ